MSAPLSERESEVIFYAAQGLTDKEIADRLDIDLSTIRTYWHRIQSKLDTVSRTHAVATLIEMRQQQQLDVCDLYEQVVEFLGECLSDIAIFSVDAAGAIRLWTSAAASFFGRQSGDVVGKSCDSLFAEEGGETFSLSRALHSSREASMAVHTAAFATKSGKSVGTLAVKPLKSDSGGHSGALILARKMPEAEATPE